MRVFDGHCDTISRCYVTGEPFLKNSGQLDLSRMAGAGQWAQLFAIFWDKKEAPQRSLWEIFQAQYEVFRRELGANQSLVAHCRTALEAEAAWSAGKQAAFLSVEGGELLECDLDKLKFAYDLGVRAVNLTWNYENALSGSNAEALEKGLTAQGRAFVVKMQELGMLVDVSHLSDPGFWDVMELAQKPVIASHSNARAVCPHKRNLTNEQFTAIIENGGVAGVNMAADFLGPNPDVDTVVRHVEHWFGLGGEKHVSLGGDWDGISQWPRGLDGIQDVGRIAERLLQLNYKEERVNDLLCNNLMRVVREVCTM